MVVVDLLQGLVEHLPLLSNAAFLAVSLDACVSVQLWAPFDHPVGPKNRQPARLWRRFLRSARWLFAGGTSETSADRNALHRSRIVREAWRRNLVSLLEAGWH